MSVVLVSPLGPHCGNGTTCSRVEHFLSGVAPVRKISCNSSELTVEHTEVKLVFALHAFKSAEVALSPQKRIVLIFGGTDVNECFRCDRKLKVMTEIVTKAVVIVCFSTALMGAAASLWPSICPKCVVIHQSVAIPDIVPNLSCRADEMLLQILSKGSKKVTDMTDVVLLPGGFRSVKGQSFAIEAWRNSEDLPLLVMIGEVLEEDTFSLIDRACEGTRNLMWCGAAPRDMLLVAMQSPRVVCVLNTSESEGQSQTVLEAMSVGALVVARDISANRYLLRHGGGLLCSSSHPGDLRNTVRKVCKMQSRERDRVRANAFATIERYHNFKTEKKLYQELALSLL